MSPIASGRTLLALGLLGTVAINVPCSAEDPHWRFAANPEWDSEGIDAVADPGAGAAGVVPLRQTHPRDTQMGVWMTSFPDLVPGTDYRVEMWFRTEPGATGEGGVCFWISFLDSAGATVGNTWTDFRCTAGAWQLYRAGVTAPDTAAVAVVRAVHARLRGSSWITPPFWADGRPDTDRADPWQWSVLCLGSDGTAPPAGFTATGSEVADAATVIGTDVIRSPGTFSLCLPPTQSGTEPSSWTLPAIDLSEWGRYRVTVPYRSAALPETGARLAVRVGIQDFQGRDTAVPVEVQVELGGGRAPDADPWQEISLEFEARGHAAWAVVTVTLKDAEPRDRVWLTDCSATRLETYPLSSHTRSLTPGACWEAAWICAPTAAEAEPAGVPVDTVYCRRFAVADDLRAAVLQVTADDAYEVRVNGVTAGQGANWRQVDLLDLTPHLEPGENLVAVRVHNSGGATGLLAEIDLEFADHRRGRIATDSTWLCTTGDAGTDWDAGQPGDTGDWLQAVRLGRPPQAPWGPLPYTPTPATIRPRLLDPGIPPVVRAGEVLVLRPTVMASAPVPSGTRFVLSLARGDALLLEREIDVSPPPEDWTPGQRLELAPIEVELSPYLPRGRYGLSLAPLESEPVPLRVEDGQTGRGFPEVTLVSTGGRTRVAVNGDLIDFSQHLLNRADPGLLRNLASSRLQVLQLACGDIGWKGPGRFEYDQVDAEIARALVMRPDVFLVLTFDLSGIEQPWWAESHESELCADAQGSTEIAYYHGTSYRLPSFASPTYRQEFGEALVRFVQHLEQSPFADRVILLKVCNGVSWEWFMWGSQHGQYVDYSAHNQAAFQEWLRTRYEGDIEALRRAWQRPDVDFDTAAIPGPEARAEARLGVFRDTLQERHAADYHEFHDYELGFATLEHFCRLAKQACSGRLLVGAYHNYQTHLSQGFFAHNASQCNQRRSMRSPWIDVVYGPTDGYTVERDPGGAGGFMCVPDSYPLWGKLWVQEADNRTFRAQQQLRNGVNLSEDIHVFRREFCLDTVYGMGLEWYDFTLGFQFADPRFVAEIDRLQALNQEIVARPNPAGKGIAVFVDDSSLPYTTHGDRYIEAQAQFLYHARPAFLRAGVPCRWYTLSDLEHEGFPDSFRACFFLNTWRMTEAQRTLIQDRLQGDGRVLVFYYAAGMLDDRGILDPEAARDVIGMDLEVDHREGVLDAQVTDADHPLMHGVSAVGGSACRIRPLFHVHDPRATPLAVYRNAPGVPAVAVRDLGSWTAVYSAPPLITPQFIRNVARAAGVHCYVEQGSDAVYVNGGGYVGLHARTTGRKHLVFPGSVTVTDLFTGRTVAEDVTEYRFDAEAKRTYLFSLDLDP